MDADLTWVGPSTGTLVFTEDKARVRDTSRGDDAVGFARAAG